MIQVTNPMAPPLPLGWNPKNYAHGSLWEWPVFLMFWGDN